MRETAQALVAFHDDPPGLVAASRRIVDRHPTSAPLWWLCARVLTAPDPHHEAWDAVDEIVGDTTPTELGLRHPARRHRLRDRLARAGRRGAAPPRRRRGAGRGLAGGGERPRAPAHARRHRRGRRAHLRASGRRWPRRTCSCSRRWPPGPTGFVAVSGSLAAATVARHAEVPVWVAVGVGRWLPARMWQALPDRQATRAADPWDLDEEVVPVHPGRPGLRPPGPRAPRRRPPPHRLPRGPRAVRPRQRPRHVHRLSRAG